MSRNAPEICGIPLVEIHEPFVRNPIQNCRNISVHIHVGCEPEIRGQLGQESLDSVVAALRRGYGRRYCGIRCGIFGWVCLPMVYESRQGEYRMSMEAIRIGVEKEVDLLGVLICNFRIVNVFLMR
jgi:hypothetical protein